MSMADKNPEVVGCDASIMKNVWEIRLREHGHKLQQEQDRVEKSALLSINKDWADRMTAKQGNKRVQRKAKPVETQTDNNNVFNNKRPQIPPRGLGSSLAGPPGGLSRGFSAAGPSHKDKKGQDKKMNRLQLLMFINQTQPSAMVWGKSWKYNKSLPPPAEGTTARLDWGQCWMFAGQQPHTEEGKPWPNGPNMMDPQNLCLWNKSAYRMMESQELDLSLPVEEWHMSWKKSLKQKENIEKPSLNEGDVVPKFSMFTLLIETERHNEVLCSSEWSESWKSTKPPNTQVPSNGPNNELINESVSNNHNKDGKSSSTWEECWRFVNHNLRNRSKMTSFQKSPSSEWASSWRAAMLVSNNHKKPDPSLGQGHSDTYTSQSQQESHLHNIVISVSREQKYRDLCSLQLCSDMKASSEWSKSWEVVKNNSKPCEEIEKVLKAAPPKMETHSGAQKVCEKPKEHFSTSEKKDPRYEQLKHEVIFRPKREFTHTMLLHLRRLENTLSFSEWKESWKTLKHHIRMERRRTRPHPSRPFREPEKGGERAPNAAEWKDSCKLTCKPLHQVAELWEQGWSTMTHVRPNRATHQNHFVTTEAPQNGPTGVQSWDESWRTTRHQHQSGPVQSNEQTRQGRQDVASHHPEDPLQARRWKMRSVADWQEAWRVSETPFHHDKPSLTQWIEAWRVSAFHTEHGGEHAPKHNWMDKSMEIQPRREKLPLQRVKAKISQLFDNQVFRERYPEKEWNTSWRAGSFLMLSHQESLGMLGKSLHDNAQPQQATTGEHGCKWGRSFRFANPMPHMEQPWVESLPNPSHYMVMWSRSKCMNNHLYANANKDLIASRVWGTSYRFLQGTSKATGKSKECHDPLVILTKKTKIRKYLYSNIETGKPTEKKWPGCHLLGKTQPRPKRSPAKNLKMQEETNDKFFEEWANSWRFLVHPDSLKKQTLVISLSGWGESWKFLLPPYPPQNGPKHNVK